MHFGPPQSICDKTKIDTSNSKQTISEKISMIYNPVVIRKGIHHNYFLVDYVYIIMSKIVSINDNYMVYFLQQKVHCNKIKALRDQSVRRENIKL